MPPVILRIKKIEIPKNVGTEVSNRPEEISTFGKQTANVKLRYKHHDKL